MRHRSSAKHKQDKRLQLFVTQKEYEASMAEYKISDLHSVSAYLRKKVVGNGIIIPDTSELKDKLDVIGYQYEKIGNNVNQIAKKMHLFTKEGRFPSDVLNRFNNLMGRYLKVTEELSRAHRAFLRQLSK